MNAITTHLDDLLAVLRASADLSPMANTAVQLRGQLAGRLDPVRPDLAARVRGMDDWHSEVLADFIAEARVVADSLEYPWPSGPPADETRVG